MQQRTQLYHSFTEDFVASAQQDYQLPEGYVWLDESALFRFQAAIARGLGFLYASCYTKLVLGMRFANREVLRQAGAGGCFIYANHTQPIGDACMPLLAARPKRAYVVVSPANFKVAGIGPFLPWLGALPTSGTVAGTRQLLEAVKARLAQGHAVTVYPEGHLWPWNTGIRPLAASAFSLPASLGYPVFAMTNTYHARKHGGKPRCTVWLDGPFWPDASLPKRQRKEQLRDAVQAAMLARAATSDCALVRYEPAEGAPAMPTAAAPSPPAAAPGLQGGEAA